MRSPRVFAALVLATLSAFGAPAVYAATPQELQKQMAATAREAGAGFSGFSAQRGQQFFNATHGNDWSCASCHTTNPSSAGRHAATHKDIAPMAPAANPQRFTDAAKVDKWFNRNCNDVLKRPCSAQEKGDVLEYLISLAK
jgi:hypothetical protein